MASESVTVAIDQEQVDWLMATYPEARSKSEAVRMALVDARTHRDLLDRSRLEADDSQDL